MKLICSIAVNGESEVQAAKPLAFRKTEKRTSQLKGPEDGVTMAKLPCGSKFLWEFIFVNERYGAHV